MPLVATFVTTQKLDVEFDPINAFNARNLAYEFQDVVDYPEELYLPDGIVAPESFFDAANKVSLALQLYSYEADKVTRMVKEKQKSV